MSNKPDFVGTPETYRNKLILFSFTIVFIVMAVGLLFQNLVAQYISPVKAAPQTIPAGGLSVVGQPSLPAATVDAIFKRLGSPMSGTGQVVAQASHETNIDDAFALAVWWTETNDGAAGVGLADRNPGSVRGSAGYPSAYDGYTIYPSYSAAIVYWFNMIRNSYVNRGLSTVYAISYPYVGTSGSPVWAGKVVALMLSYRGEAPPAPTVVQHGKKVTEPAVYAYTTPAPLAKQAQSQAGKPSKQSPDMSQQVNTPPVLPPSIEYAIVFLALLLALAMVVCSLWLDKRQPIHSSQGDNAQGEVVQGGDKPRPYYIRNARPFRSIALYALIQNEDAPKTDSLVMRAKEMDSGAIFRIRRTLLLPSTPVVETAKSGESPAGSSPGGRSTGLLSRYGETHQE